MAAMELADIVVDDALMAEVLARVSRPDFHRWEAQVAQAGHCRHPVRVSGTIDQVDKATGERIRVYSTEAEPDSVLLMACGNRRESVCPPCAYVYRGDTYHLILAGLVGGCGVPESVVDHPAVFATFTAPSFGVVHSRRMKGHTQLACHPRARSGQRCPHGVRMHCGVRHPEGDARLGTPICAECFAYEAQVLWNRMAPKLWKRTTGFIRRRLAKAAGVSVRKLPELCRVRFSKVAEYQLRGAVHFHAVIRLDGYAEDDSLVAPPAQFSSELLEEAIRETVRELEVAGIDGLPVLAWGQEVHIRHLRSGVAEDLSREALAGYIAKYCTKGPESLAAGPGGASEHVLRLIRTAHDLDAAPEHRELRLGEAAGALGYRGHFSTRSRRYSTSLKERNQVRIDFARARHRERCQQPVDAWGRPEDSEAVVIEARWRFAGTGHLTTGDAYLALSSEARARWLRENAKQELFEVEERERRMGLI